MRSPRFFEGPTYLCLDDFRFAEEPVAGFASDFAALLAADLCAALLVPAALKFGEGCAVDCVFARDVEDLRRCPLDVRAATTGSATWRRLPGSTLMPVSLFQRRN